VIETGSQASIRNLDIDLEHNILYACCTDDGRIYGYNLGSNLSVGMVVTKVLSLNGPFNCRSMTYVKQIQKLIIGYQSGIIALYDTDGGGKVFCMLKSLEKAPRKCSNEDIFFRENQHANYKF
jgi:hypothetical protein